MTGLAPPAYNTTTPYFTRRKEGDAAIVQDILTLRNLQKRAGAGELLKGIDLSLKAGEFVALWGPAGSGKTVLMRILAGFDKPSFGRVLIAGQDMTGLPPGRRKLCAMFLDTPLFPHRTVLANVAYGLKLAGVSRRERLSRAAHMLALSGLEEEGGKRPRQLSPFQYKMAVLVRALVLRPRLLLLDDPFSRLEMEERRQALAFIKALQQQWHFSVLYTTRDREEAMAVAHRMALMADGRIAQAGTPEEIYRQPQSAGAARSMGAVNLLPCTVSARRPDGQVSLDMDGLTLPAQSVGAPPAMGEDVVLCLRPGQVQVFDAPRPNTFLSGLFMGFRREGEGLYAVVSLPTGRELLCDEAQAASLKTGSRVFIRWDIAKAALIAEEEDIGSWQAPPAGGREAPLCIP